MGVRYLAASSVCTVLSFFGLYFWTEVSLERLQSEGLLGDNYLQPEKARRIIELLLGSYTTLLLVVNCVFHVFVLLTLCLKVVFFGELYPAESRKLVERLINYVIYKGTFLPLVVPQRIFQAGLWSAWMTILCSLKMFQALGRDRLERLNATPSATPWGYLRVYSVLWLVLTVDVLWMWTCLMLSTKVNSSMFLLLFYEPLSIAFETLQAILVHGFQLFDIWLNHSVNSNQERFKYLDSLTKGSLWEWKGILIRNLGFILDMAASLMALGHYLHIWWLHGMAFHLVDAVLFLNIRALVSAIIKRIKGFIRLRKALGSLDAALPDATSEEILAYEDDCAICREPMAKAKKLHCNHLFHLSCLRSWLDQASNEAYSCPTCRKPLVVGRTESETNPRGREVLLDEQLARQLSSGLDQQNTLGHSLPLGVFPNQTQNLVDGGGAWRSAGLDSTWLHSWPSSSVDGAGPSTAIRSVGLGRVQMMMRQLASVGETYAQTALDDPSWSLWPMNPAQATAHGSPVPPPAGRRFHGGASGLHRRTASSSASDNIANILAMAETVREVLPHIPDEVILQDLQRTNSATVTVNNLLQM